jgi:hypothetical protein
MSSLEIMQSKNPDRGHNFKPNDAHDLADCVPELWGKKIRKISHHLNHLLQFAKCLRRLAFLVLGQGLKSRFSGGT